MSIHPTAIVHPDAEIAEDAEVGPYTLVGPRVRVGSESVIGPHCVLDGDTVLGARNQIYSGSQIGILSQDKKHAGELLGKTLIGSDNVIREHVTISASTMSSEADDHRVTSIGDGCLIMTGSHVAHDCHLGSHITIANYVALSGHIDIEDKASIGGLNGIHQEVVVGTLSFIGGMSRTTKDVPPYMLVEGNPCRCIGPNSVGLQRAGFDAEARSRVKAIFKIMFRSNLNTTQALHEIERSVDDSPERTHFVEFVRRSVRGITK